MDDLKLGAIESHFADIIWQREPIGSGDLVRICRDELGWQKSTTYTVLRKLCDRGIFRNDGGTVTSLISREEFDALRGKQFIDEIYHGSLPAFIAAFTKKNALNEAEITEIRRMIDTYGKEDGK